MSRVFLLTIIRWLVCHAWVTSTLAAGRYHGVLAVGSWATRVAVFDLDDFGPAAHPILVLETPSWVSIASSGEVSTGVEAQRLYSSNIPGTIPELPRFLGRTLSEATTIARLRNFTFTTSTLDGRVGVVIRFNNGTFVNGLAVDSHYIGRSFLSLFERLLGDTFRRLDQTLAAPIPISLLRPSDLNDEGLRQLVSAVAAVGFHVTHVQSETVAAVFGAFPTLGMNHTLLVVDVGGSSCKLSLVRQDLATEVIAQVIDPFCGGTYFDDEVYDYMLRHHRRIAESPAYLSALSSALEQAKRDLVHSESAQIQLDVGSMGNVTWHLDRHIFETVNKALYLSLAQKISRFLADEQSGVHKIILTGGSALAPGLAATLSQSLAHHSAEVRTITNSTVVLQRSALLLTARRRVSLAFDLVFQSYRGNFTLIEKGTVLPFHQSFRLGRPILSTRTTIKLWQIHGDDYTYPVALQTFWMPMQSSLVVDLSVMDDGQLHGRAYDGTKQSLQSSFDGSVLVNCTWVQTTTRTD